MEKNNKNIQIKGQKHGQILGINITSSSIDSLLTRVENFISCNTKFYIVTPNPEIILMAQTDQKLKNALNYTDLAIPDGVGLKFAIPNLNIIKGRELFSALIKLAVKKNWKVFLLGGLGNEAEIASRNLQLINNNLQIRYHKGPKLNNDAKPASEIDKKIQDEVIQKINEFAPELLFVAFGNPKQEIWVHDYYSKLNIGGAMAVGGAFRYTAGLSKIPPKWIAKTGFEWLWRLITEPRRIGRIINATVVFPIKVLLSRFN